MYCTSGVYTGARLRCGCVAAGDDCGICSRLCSMQTRNPLSMSFSSFSQQCPGDKEGPRERQRGGSRSSSNTQTANRREYQLPRAPQQQPAALSPSPLPTRATQLWLHIVSSRLNSAQSTCHVSRCAVDERTKNVMLQQWCYPKTRR